LILLLLPALLLVFAVAFAPVWGLFACDAAVVMVLPDVESPPLMMSFFFLLSLVFYFIFFMLRGALHVVLPLSVRKCTCLSVTRVTVALRSFSSVQGAPSGQLDGFRIWLVILILSPATSSNALVAGRLSGRLRSASRRVTLILSSFISSISSLTSMFMNIFSFYLETMLYNRYPVTVVRQS
jgi:hypothetical protein